MDGLPNLFEGLPVASYEEFLEGYRRKPRRYLIGMWFDLRSLGWFPSVVDRAIMGVVVCCPLLVAAGFAVLALRDGKAKFWIAAVMFVCDYAIASGRLSIVRWLYWVPLYLLSFPALLISVPLGDALMYFSPYLFLTQACSTVGKGVVDIRVLQAIEESEANFVWFFSRRIISLIDMETHRWYWCRRMDPRSDP